MLRLQSERREGKIRGLLLFDGGKMVVVAGTLRGQGFLDIWDSSSNKFTASISVDSPVVSLAWLRPGTSHYVVLLCADGTQRLHGFKAAKINLRAKREKYYQSLLAHQASLSCYGSVVASSSGFELVFSDILGQGSSKVDAADTNSGIKLHPNSYISHIHLLSKTTILVFFYQEEKIVEFDLERRVVRRAVSVKHTMAAVSVSAPGDLVVFHDAKTGAMVYSRKTKKIKFEVPGARKRGLAVPLGFTFTSDKPVVFVGDKDVLRLFFFDEEMNREIETGSRRIYAVDVVPCPSQVQVMNVIMATMPQDIQVGDTLVESGGWDLQLWELDSRMPSETTEGSTTTQQPNSLPQAGSVDLKGMARALSPTLHEDDLGHPDNQDPSAGVSAPLDMLGIEPAGRPLYQPGLVESDGTRKPDNMGKEPQVPSKRALTPHNMDDMPGSKKQKLGQESVVSTQHSRTLKSNTVLLATITAQGVPVPDSAYTIDPVHQAGPCDDPKDQSHMPPDLGDPLPAETAINVPVSNSDRIQQNPGWLMQQRPCGGHQSLSSCRGCKIEGLWLSGKDCRFVNFRRHQADGKYDFGLEDTDSPIENKASMEFSFRNWKPSRTEKDIKTVKLSAAQYLLPKIKAEIQHIGRVGNKFRTFEHNTNYSCDICSMGLFFEVWFCGRCGLELCNSCHSLLPMFIEEKSTLTSPCPDPSVHSKHRLFPVTFFTRDDLEPNLQAMESLVQSYKMNISTSASTRIPRENRSTVGADVVSIKRYKCEDLTNEEITQLWESMEPFVLVEVFDPVPPSELFDLNDNDPHPCIESAHDGSAWVTQQISLESYFKRWGREKVPGPAKQIRDYPPFDDLQTIHPDLYRNILSCLESMFEDYMSPRGPLNLFSYFPQESQPPDLGPKLYIAEGDRAHKGTTFVHMDKSGAVNVLLHSLPSRTQGPIGARWQIWPSDGHYALSKALDPAASEEDCRMAQPIVSEVQYASDDVISTAFQLDGIPHWSFVQMPGEAVIIPPGCPHQVSNLGSCIKFACDFITPSHIPVLAELPKIFGLMNTKENSTVHTDLLQLDAMLWYAWRST